MLPRRNRPSIVRGFVFRVFSVLVFVGFIMISAAPAGSQEKAPLPHVPGLIRFYQKYISPVDGQRCPMVPSCSTYMKNCVKKHGLLTGWIMGMDRIVRCGRDEVKISSPVWINGKKYIYDPVENNDFWWSDK